jgi:hypothetical protein
MRAVIVTYEEHDWALILTLWRDGDGHRELSSLLVVPNTSQTFPGLTTRDDGSGSGIQILRTEHVKEGARTAHLHQCVLDYVSAASQYYQVLETRSPGLLANWVSRNYAGLEVPNKAVLRFLYESKCSREMLQAVRLVYQLADKHNLLEQTLEETDRAAMHKILNQRTPWSAVQQRGRDQKRKG